MRITSSEGATASTFASLHRADSGRSDRDCEPACVVVTDVPPAEMSGQAVHDSYVHLQRVERDFRQMKTGLLEVRPVFVRKDAAIVPAGPDGSINVYTLMENGATTDVIMDINGYFAPAATGGLSLFPVTPCRAVDTRASEGKTGAFGPPSMPSGGSSRTFPLPASTCNLPSTAQAYALNVTVVPTGNLGYLTIWPTGLSMPVVSTLNSWDGRIVANAALVPAGTNGAVDVYTLLSTGAITDLVLDVFGYFAP